MKVSAPQQPLPQLPANVPPPPVIGATPGGQKPPKKSATPSFLGSADVPSKTNIGQKQLVGQ